MIVVVLLDENIHIPNKIEVRISYLAVVSKLEKQ